MVLLGLGTTWGYTQWLHREDFVFELSKKKADEKGGRGHGKLSEASASTRAKLAGEPAGEPSQYWLLGFKDRHLEREYLADLVDANSDRLLVGSFLCLVVFGLMDFMTYTMRMIYYDGYAGGKSLIPTSVVSIVIPMVFFSLALFTTIANNFRWIRRKQVVLCSIEFAYLAYIISNIPYSVEVSHDCKLLDHSFQS